MGFNPETVLPTGSDTLLVISGVGGFQYMARGLDQTLAIIEQSKHTARTINAVLRDISNPAFRKYRTEITCTDVTPPPFDNLWSGMIVTVQCAIGLSYTTGNPGSPFKPQVSGSSYVQGMFTIYRPELEMMVMDVNTNFAEWKADVGWKLILEEV